MAIRGLFFFFLVLIVAWRWRQWREAKKQIPQRDADAPHTSTTMIACHTCGVHLPVADAVKGGRGRFYCCAAHRK